MIKTLLFLCLVLIPLDAVGYEVNVHRDIADHAITSSNIRQYLDRNLGIILEEDKFKADLFPGKTAKEWIKTGSDWEDATIGASASLRFMNHFYDPTTGLGLNVGGIPVGDAVSSLVWGRGHVNNLFDWANTRDSYAAALTSANPTDRNAGFANVFRSLGQMIHLVHDKAVPAHVRNDAHLPMLRTQRDMYERYTRDAANGSNHYPPLLYAGYESVDLQTFNTFDSFWSNGGKGLAEFTNRNFLSRNTNIDDNEYALPTGIPGPGIFTETIYDPITGPFNVVVKYLLGNVTDQYRPTSSPAIRLAAYSYFDFEMMDQSGEPTFSLNNNVHYDYANYLIPRAVGYSAGLLNYFFRGNIDITVPASGVYAIADSTSGGFTTIKLRAQNTTENEEEMPDGSIELVIKYQPTQDAPFSYRVVSEATGTRTIPRDAPTELSFNLGQSLIPFSATDVYLQLVYHGRLGNEDGAVAVGFNDISEPTPIDIYNNMDKICIGGSWYNAGSQAAKNQADQLGNQNGIADDADIYPHNLKTVYLKLSSADDPQWASDTVYDVVTSNVPPATLRRMAYILAELEPSDVPDFYYSLYDVPGKIDSADTWGQEGIIYQIPGVAVQNQVVEDPALCEGATSCRQKSIFYSFRGIEMWWGGGLIYTNVPYPTGSQCSIGSI